MILGLSELGKKTCPSNGEATIIFGGGQCSIEVKCEVIEKLKIEGITLEKVKTCIDWPCCEVQQEF